MKSIEFKVSVPHQYSTWYVVGEILRLSNGKQIQIVKQKVIAFWKIRIIVNYDNRYMNIKRIERKALTTDEAKEYLLSTGGFHEDWFLRADPTEAKDNQCVVGEWLVRHRVDGEWNYRTAIEAAEEHRFWFEPI